MPYDPPAAYPSLLPYGRVWEAWLSDKGSLQGLGCFGCDFALLCLVCDAGFFLLGDAALVEVLLPSSRKHLPEKSCFPSARSYHIGDIQVAQWLVMVD